MQSFNILALALFAYLLSTISVRAYDEKPTGLAGSELTDYEHLSLGADFVPYDWLIHMKSALFKGPDGKPASFATDLDKRFNFFVSKDTSRYLLPYVGVSASWSNQDSFHSDAYKSDGFGMIREGLGGKKSIRMVGTTCSVCHLGGASHKGAFYSIQAMPGNSDTNGFFTDLALSLLQLISQPPMLRDFLMNFGYSKDQASKEAWASARAFLNELGYDAGKRGKRSKLEGWNDLVAVRTFIDAIKMDFHRLNKGKPAMRHALERLLKLTFKADATELGDVMARLEFAAAFLSGDAANLKVIPVSFGRFDAFDRPANMILGKPIFDVNGPVRYPPMWSLKYMAMFHYNANTNSFLGRSIIEANAAGVAKLDDKGASTLNLHNIHRIGDMLYKLKVPSWIDTFGSSPADPALRINSQVTTRGKQLYEQKCATCHEVKRSAGPRQELYDYKVLPFEVLGTDPHEGSNRKGYGEAYAKGLFGLILSQRNAYYAKYSIAPETQALWEYRDIRGLEFFRETIEGAKGIEQKFGTNYGDIEPGNLYKATHLSGSWALRTYLHNGSVPTLWDLLQPSSKRPKYFNTKSYEFDPKLVGLHNNRDPNQPCGKKETEGCVDTTIEGNSNLGHENRPGVNWDFGTDMSDSDKLALIEYLKILPPEPEYAW